MRRAVLVSALACVLGALGPSAAPAATPTSITILRGNLDDGGEFKTMVSIQRVARGRARIVAMRLDSKPSSEVYDLVVTRANYCSSDSWAGQSAARLAVRDRRVTGVRRAIPDRALRSGVSVMIVDRGARSGRPDACARAGRFARDGMILSPRDSASGLPTGVATFQVTGPGTARMLALLALDSSRDFMLGVIDRPCSEGFVASDDLWTWRKDIVAGVADQRRLPWPIAGSFAIVDRGTTTPAQPFACVDEEDFPFN